jgi:hypothetical protein
MTFQKLRADIAEKSFWGSEIFGKKWKGEETDPQVLRSSYSTCEREYSSLRDQLTSIYKDAPPSNNQKVLLDLDVLDDFVKKRQNLEQAMTWGKQLFGELWHGQDSDPLELNGFCNWIQEFRKLLDAGLVTEKALSLLSPVNQSKEISLLADRI